MRVWLRFHPCSCSSAHLHNQPAGPGAEKKKMAKTSHAHGEGRVEDLGNAVHGMGFRGLEIRHGP
jgi:hypothetical protein